MYKSDIRVVLLALLINMELYGEIDTQKGIYDAAEEMIRFDEKMNQAIAKHNQITPEEDEFMRLNDMMISDFEETAEGYQLEREILYPSETEVDVKLEDGVLTVTTTTQDIKVIKNDLNISKIMSTESSSFSLFLPPDADENRMVKNYSNGILTITIPKK